jgi:hypothetical protein
MSELITPLRQQPQTVTLTDAERQPCEIWTRVMGYHRPVSSFNTGKKGEFHERKYFTEQGAGLCR